jgi:small-conductance mechanosensitive channel
VDEGGHLVEEKEKPARVSGIALLVAVAVLIAFTAFVGFMITQRGAAETPWTRLAWLFSSVEAIAFGAAGALFGSSIQRQRAETAENTAKENQEAASKGRALAEALKSEVPAPPDASTESFGGRRNASGPVEERHAALARSLFP